MIRFDIRTASLLVSLLYFILPLTAWIILSRQRSRSVTLWCGSGLLFSLGVLFVGLRGNVPDWVSFPLANLLIFYAIMMRIQSLRLDGAKPWKVPWMASAAVLFIVVYECVDHWMGSTLRIQYALLVEACFFLVLVSQAWHIGREQEHRSAYWIAGAYLILAGTLLLRVVALGGGWGSVDTLVASPDLVLITLAAVLASVVGNIGYVGIFLERSLRQQVEDATRSAAEQDVARTCVVEALGQVAQSEMKFRAVFEQSPMGVSLIDVLTGRILEVNERYAEITGRTREELTAIDWMRITHPDDLQADQGNMLRLKNGEIPGFQMDKRYIRPDGSVVWVHLTVTLVTMAAEGKNCYLGLVEDITEHKQSQERLRISEERYRLAADNALDVIWTMGLDGTTSYVSPSVEKVRGFTAAEAMQQTLHEILTPDSQAIVSKYFSELQNAVQAGITPESFRGELEYRCKDGSTFWTEVLAYPLLGPEGAFVEVLGVTRDISERKRYESELQQARIAAEAASQTKSDFLANMSHEIRTPMNAVLGLAQLLEQENLLHEQRDMVHQILTAGRSLLGILNDVLDISKIEAGQLGIEMRPFSLLSILNQLERLMGNAIRSKGIVLHIDTSSEIPDSLVGDDLRLEQILINLLGNAIKFTEQGEIRVVVHQLENVDATILIRFEVHDSGVGIAPDVVTTLFNPFTQADASITRRFGGTGLGLSICKRLVELMGGTIGVESREGSGSTFWFELPFQRMAIVVTKTVDVVREAPPAGQRLFGRRFLVVDDSDVNQTVVVKALTREGAGFELAGNGQEALDKLRVEPSGFDAVLMDVQMPVMDGLTATRIMRDDVDLAGIPVIALTAGVLPDERQNALDSGVNGFLPKPVDLEELVALLLYVTNPDMSTGVPVPVSIMTTSPVSTGKNDRALPELFFGLDLVRGIASLSGDEKLYRKLINEFVRVHGKDDAEIREALTTGSPERASKMAHALKGVAGNLAVSRVHRIAIDLDAALKLNQVDNIDRQLFLLTEALLEVRNASLHFGEAPVTHAPSGPFRIPDLVKVLPLLDALTGLLRQRRMAALDVTQQLSELLAGTSVESELVTLSVAVERLEFVAAQSLVSKLVLALADDT